MYKESEISLQVFDSYYKLVDASRSNTSQSNKLPVLKDCLYFFCTNYENLNSDERKLIKNVLLIAKPIMQGAYVKNSTIRNLMCECKSLIQEINSKQKEPVK